MNSLHLNWDGYQNNGVVFNTTYDGCLFTGELLKPILAFSFHSFNYDKNPKVANQVITEQEELRLMTPEEEEEVRVLAASWEQELGQEGNPTNEQKLDFIRFQRNDLLRETDHFALTDQTLTPEMSAYRQALRDMTLNVNLDNPIFPVKPS